MHTCLEWVFPAAAEPCSANCCLCCWQLPLTGFVEEDSPYASSGQKGTYYFEFSRPLRTMDRLQQVPSLLLLSFLLL